MKDAPSTKCTQHNNILISKNCIFFFSCVNLKNTKKLIKRLFFLAEKYNDIHLYINSVGGDFYASIGTYDILRFLQNKKSIKINTYAVGLVASAATLIFLGGNDRFCFENSLFLVHGGDISFSGNVNDIKLLARQTEKENDIMAKIYTQNSNQTKNFWKKKLKTEYFFDAAEAFSIGFVKDILK